MKFGLGPLSGQIPPDTTLRFDNVYEQSLQLAEQAEASGFSSVWVSEHHFTDDGYLPSPMSLAGALAARTDSVEVGTALALAPLYEPVRLAEDAAVVDNIAHGGAADGKFTLGIGLGYRDQEYEGIRVKKDERVGRLLDVVDTCREAWQGESLSKGRIVEYPEITVTPQPATDIDILIGAMAPTALERTARIGDGYLVPPSVMLDGLSEKLETIANELTERDRNPADFPIYMLRYGFPHEDGKEAAWEAIREEYLYLRRKYLEWFNESDDSKLDLTEKKLNEMVADNEDKWQNWAILGDANDWIGALEPYDDAWEGDVTSIVQLRYPGMDYDVVKQAVEYVGAEVIPVVQD